MYKPPTSTEPSATTNNSQEGMRTTVELATKMANTMLVCLRETYHYLVPKAKAEGIEIDAQSAHALAVSLWIQLARERAWLRMPATRFERKDDKPPREPKRAKTELFPRSGPAALPGEATRPFSNPGVSPALRKLRELLQRDAVDEQEVLRVLHEAAPRGATPPTSLDQATEQTLGLLLDRWEVTRELIEAARDDGGEAA